MLMRFEPFRELDRLTQQVWGGLQGRPAAMPMDAYRHGDRYVVHLDLPGVDPGSIDLTVEKNALTVSAERAAQRADDQEWLVAERPQGRFSRQVFLSENLDTERIEASYDHGVLTITVPVVEAARARKVAVTSGNGAGHRSITAQSGAGEPAVGQSTAA